MEASLRDSPKLRLLRIFKFLAAVAAYCARNAGRLVVLVWFPCLLVVPCQIALDWLTVAYPPQLPAWLLSNNFNPPTWLTAVAITPWGAMAWAFVLSGMAERNSNRGLVTARLLRRGRLRFEFSREVFLTAAIFSAVNLLDGVLRTAQLKFLASLYPLYRTFDLSDAALNAWGKLAEAAQVLIMAAVFAWSYLVVGRLLRSGTLGIAHVWRIMRGNRLRLYAVFLLLSVAEIALDQLAAPATNWLIRSSYANELSWTLGGALIRYLADLPFFLLWTVIYAVTVGLALDVLERRPPRPHITAAAAPLPRPGGSRPSAG